LAIDSNKDAGATAVVQGTAPERRSGEGPKGTEAPERGSGEGPKGPRCRSGNGAANRTAARVIIPVEFLLQRDDELVPREPGLARFDAFAPAEKTRHATPGRHAEGPRFEAESSLRFFGRHLGG
jgi:hypothetical protein